MLTLKNADCLDALKEMQADTIDALITDPPAGISFMGKDWDKGVQFIERMSAIYAEVLRVLKPGAHGLVWAIPRTSHWTATALEQAGFEIRDVVTHVFGTGFPKSLNIGKALPQWQGWGTALKPASEHWILIRKPLGETTVAKNVLKHGTGGLNIDESRIGRGSGRFPANFLLSHNEDCEEACTEGCAASELDRQSGVSKSIQGKKAGGKTFHGVVYNGEERPQFGDTGGASRFFYVAKASKRDRNEGLEDAPDRILARSGGASAAAARGEKYNNGDSAFNKTIICKNNHPTVKSTKLMEYLIRLVTPTQGIVLDPFMGSGSTGVAAKRLGFGFIGIEKETEYFAIAEKRINFDNVI